MEWRERRLRAGPRLTAGLAMFVGVLSVITGIINIGTIAVYGPLAEIIHPSITTGAGFTGTITGFLLMVSAYGLRRRLRVSYHAALLLLPLTALQGLFQLSPVSAPLVIISVITIPNILANRTNFTEQVSLSDAQIAAALALAGSLLYGTVGTYAMRHEFDAVDTLLDAFYFTIVTATTVGYGDAIPTTQEARLFGMSVLIVGTSSFAVAAGSLLFPIIESRFSEALGKMTSTEIKSITDHVLILGYGELTDPILRELSGKTDFVIVSKDEKQVQEFRANDISSLLGDPSDDDPLARAGLQRAVAAIIASNNDAEDALTVLTVRKLRPDIRIIAAASEIDNIEKLRRAGADVVISPAAIGGRLLVHSALGEDDTEAIADRLGI